MSKPLVSILIPAFNAQEWIAETLRSALAQTWEHKELIVVDDGSTDATFEIAHSFESSSLRVLRQRNQGAAAARNQAFRLSRGEYIQWLDADDLLEPDKIEQQMKALSGCPPNTIASCAWGSFMYRPHRARLIPNALWSDLDPVEWLLRKMEHNLYMQTATWLVSRQLTEAVGPWDTRLLGDDDNEYFCRVLLASGGVRFVPEAMMYYRAFGYGTLRYVGRSDEKLRAHWLSMQLHIRHLRAKDDSERVRNACIAYLQTWLHYFYAECPDIAAEMEELAQEMGEQLHPPELSWKYLWLKTLFGWRSVRPFQVSARQFRWWMQASVDKLLSHFDRPDTAPIITPAKRLPAKSQTQQPV